MCSVKERTLRVESVLRRVTAYIAAARLMYGDRPTSSSGLSILVSLLLAGRLHRCRCCRGACLVLGLCWSHCAGRRRMRCSRGRRLLSRRLGRGQGRLGSRWMVASRTVVGVSDSVDMSGVSGEYIVEERDGFRGGRCSEDFGY